MTHFRILILAFLSWNYILIQTSLAADWPTFGGNLASQKYSALDQINADNVNELKLIWGWNSPANATVETNRTNGITATPGAFKPTPLVVNGVIYVSTPFGAVAAVDAVSGREKWVFETRSWEAGFPVNLGYNHRGVEYWSRGDDERILMATNDAYLWSLDAKTGFPDTSFGEDGKIDLTKGLRREVIRGEYAVNSPPLVVNDIVVVGNAQSDVTTIKEAPPGDVRGFDVRTGEQRWIFHTVPMPGEYGYESWEDASAEYTGNTNVWSLMSADEELGIVYLPVGTPTNDFYGGHRPGDNLFGDSLVAVDSETGARIWHFQIVHHGVFDYEPPAAPVLVDINVEGRTIKAVAQVSKQGFVYVFDRVNGDPVWPIVETPVPVSDVPGERLSPTQPIPTKPKPFELQELTAETVINFTPELKAEALEIISQYDHGELYTPASVRGTIRLPGWEGGATWQGAGVDPETNILYVPSARYPILAKLNTLDRSESNVDYVRSGSVSVPGPQGLPLTIPPYGSITAIDLNTGEHKWQVPHGEGVRQQVIALGIPDPGPLGSADRTGPLITKTLLFVGQRDAGRTLLRAYNKDTGEVIHELELPSLAVYGTPVTYSIDGKQYITIAIGGGPQGELVTYALP